MDNYYFTNVYSLLIDNPQNEEAVEVFNLPIPPSAIEQTPQSSEAPMVDTMMPPSTASRSGSGTTSQNGSGY